MRDYLVELFEPLFYSLCKFIFFSLEFGDNSFLVCFDVRICFLILLHIEPCKVYECGVVDAERSAISHSATDKSAKHVALVDVGRRNRLDVAKQEGSRSRVVGDYTHSDCHLLVLAVLLARQLFEFFDGKTEQIRLINRLVAV